MLRLSLKYTPDLDYTSPSSMSLEVLKFYEGSEKEKKIEQLVNRVKNLFGEEIPLSEVTALVKTLNLDYSKPVDVLYEVVLNELGAKTGPWIDPSITGEDIDDAFLKDQLAKDLQQNFKKYNNQDTNLEEIRKNLDFVPESRLLQLQRAIGDWNYSLVIKILGDAFFSNYQELAPPKKKSGLKLSLTEELNWAQIIGDSQYTQEFIWAIYKGEVFVDERDIPHYVWFEELMLPVSGTAFDKVARGIGGYTDDTDIPFIEYVEGSGGDYGEKQFWNNLDTILSQARYPKNTAIIFVSSEGSRRVSSLKLALAPRKKKPSQETPKLTEKQLKDVFVNWGFDELYLWLIYRDKLYIGKGEPEQHSVIADKLGLPTAGLDWDRIVKGYAGRGSISQEYELEDVSHLQNLPFVIYSVGLEEEKSLWRHLDTLLKRTNLPSDTPVFFMWWDPFNPKIKRIAKTAYLSYCPHCKENSVARKEYITKDGTKKEVFFCINKGCPGNYVSPAFPLEKKKEGSLKLSLKTPDPSLEWQQTKRKFTPTQAPYKHGLWAIYNGQPYITEMEFEQAATTGPSGDRQGRLWHSSWFKELGIPNKDFDKVARGIYYIESDNTPVIELYMDTQSDEGWIFYDKREAEFWGNVDKLIQRLQFPPLPETVVRLVEHYVEKGGEAWELKKKPLASLKLSEQTKFDKKLLDAVVQEKDTLDKLWAFYNGKVYLASSDVDYMPDTHAEWFDEIGLPVFGAAFDKVLRGYLGNVEVTPGKTVPIITYYEGAGTEEEFWSVLDTILKTAKYPKNTKVFFMQPSGSGVKRMGSLKLSLMPVPIRESLDYPVSVIDYMKRKLRKKKKKSYFLSSPSEAPEMVYEQGKDNKKLRRTNPFRNDELNTDVKIKEDSYPSEEKGSVLGGLKLSFRNEKIAGSVIDDWLDFKPFKEEPSLGLSGSYEYWYKIGMYIFNLKLTRAKDERPIGVLWLQSFLHPNSPKEAIEKYYVPVGKTKQWVITDDAFSVAEEKAEYYYDILTNLTKEEIFNHPLIKESLTDSAREVILIDLREGAGEENDEDFENEEGEEWKQSSLKLSFYGQEGQEYQTDRNQYIPNAEQGKGGDMGNDDESYRKVDSLPRRRVLKKKLLPEFNTYVTERD